MARHGLLILAIIAALLAAPPVASVGANSEPVRDVVVARTGAQTAAEGSDGPATADDGALATNLLVGLAGVAAVALVGSALLAVGRRRRTPEDPSPPEAAVTANSPIVTGRARRLARAADVDDDPILASLGIGRARTAPRSGRERMTKRDGS